MLNSIQALAQRCKYGLEVRLLTVHQVSVNYHERSSCHGRPTMDRFWLRHDRRKNNLHGP